MSICGDEAQICRSCLAVLWHLERRAAATPKPVTHKPLAAGKPPGAQTVDSEPPPSNP
jgi:hypothetical protein